MDIVDLVRNRTDVDMLIRMRDEQALCQAEHLPLLSVKRCIVPWWRQYIFLFVFVFQRKQGGLLNRGLKMAMEHCIDLAFPAVEE